MLQKSVIAATLVAAACALSSSRAQAQTPYIVADSVGTYTEITGGTTYVPDPYSFFNAWDEGYVEIPLPFTFVWYGNNYDIVYAYTNGFLSFNPPPAGAGLLSPPNVIPQCPTANPTCVAQLVHNFIGVMWSDLDGPAGAEFRAQTSGAVGSRVFTVQLKNFRDFGNMLSSVNFQVKFYEGNSSVEIVMGPNGLVAGATTGIENANGTEGINLLAPSGTCGPGCSCSPGLCSSSNWQPTGRTFTITLPTGPELTGEVIGPRGAYPGTSFDATVRLRNLGLTDTGPFGYRIVLSDTTSSTASATVLAEVTNPGVAPSSTFEEVRTLTMPAGLAVDTYYLALQIDVDDEVEEVIEGNNLVFDGRGIATAPDLTVSLTAPATSGPGEVMPLNVTVRSNGAPVTDPVSLSFYLSTDAMIDGSDHSLGPATILLADGFTGTDTIQVTVPLGAAPSPPDYFVLARVDATGVVPEINENNNDEASEDTVTLEGPELEAIDMTSGPFAFRGLPYSMSTTVRNNGGSTARDFTVCFVISRNLLISVISDPILLETSPMTLLPGERATVSVAPVVGTMTATGAYYIAGVADCVGNTLEANETNNTRRRMDQIIVRDPAPDFAISEITTATAAAAGETVPVSVRIANLGNQQGATTVRFVVSTNAGITPEDTTIHETTVPVTLDPAEESTVSVWAELPGDLASGLYYIGAIVDPSEAVYEVYEDNNAAGAGPVALTGSNLAIVTPQPPNAVIGVNYVRRFSAIGGTQAYQWTLTWENGSGPAGLSFDASSGELSGVPAAGAEGRYAFNVRVTSGSLGTARDYVLIVTQPTVPLSIVSSRVPPGLLNEVYMVQLIAVGGTPPFTWSVVGMAPPGLAVTESGELGGEPQLIGAFTFNVAVQDLAGSRATGTVAIDVIDPMTSVTITTADIPRADLGVPYEVTFTVDGGTAPYSWKFDRSEPIPGFEFLVDSAQLVGTPTVAGEYGFIVEVRDAKGLLDRNAYVLKVSAPGDLVITTGQTPESQLPSGTVGVPYTGTDGVQVRLRAVRRAGGSLGALTWTIVDGEPPPGINVAPDGLVQGTPTAAGKYPFRVLVTNPEGDFAFAAMVIEIISPDMPPDMMIDDGCSCTATESRSHTGSLALIALAALLFARRRRLGVLVLALATTTEARAQFVPYQVTQTTETYEPLGAAAIPVTPPLGDASTIAIPLPFDFYLYGDRTNTIYINANGLVGTHNIRAGHHFPPSVNPDPSLLTGFVAALWDDWCSSSGCTGGVIPGIGVFYELNATAGTLSIEWRHIRHYSDFSAPSDLNFKMVLHAGLSSKVEFSYGPMGQGGDFFGGPTQYRARIGLEKLGGTAGMWIGPCAGPIACTFAELTSLTDQKITLLADAGDDVAMSSVSIPTVGYPGLPIPVTARFYSRHQNPLGPTTVAAYLLPSSETSTAAGRLIWTSEPITLGGFESLLLSFEGEVPADVPVGQYRVALVADYLHELAETDETNNVSFSTTSVRIADRAPDFRITRVLPLQTQRAPGDTLQVAYTIDNFGNEPGRLQAQAYLSTNAAITTTDVPFGAPLSFDSTSRQVFTGTVSAPIPMTLSTGSYYVGFIVDPELTTAELSESNNVGRAPAPITISASNVEIITEALPPATIGLSYSATVRAAGGNGTFTYRLASGTIPRGMTFNVMNAELFGIPLEAGTFDLEIEARSGTLLTRKTLPLAVLDPTLPLTIVTQALPPGVLGQDYAVTPRAIGGIEPYTWRVSDGSLPPGIVLATDGTLIGAPTQTTFASFELEVRDNEAMTARVGLSLEVRSPGNLTIVSSLLPEARLGEEYSQALFASGGIPPLTWRPVTTGDRFSDPPPGLVVLPDGTLSGTPEILGTYHFRIEVTDTAGNVDTNLLSIEVIDEGRFGIATMSLPDGVPGEEYSVVIEGTGGVPPYTWEVVRNEGALPPGFSATEMKNTPPAPETLVIAGKLEREGTWTFTVRLHDAQGRSDDRPFAIVSRTPPPPPMMVEEGGCTCVAPRRSESASLWLFALGLVVALGRFRRRAALALGLALAVSFATRAEAQLYITTQYSQAYVPLGGGTQLSFANPDEGAELAPIGFPFTFYGLSYTHVNVGVNGLLSFAASCSSTQPCADQDTPEFCGVAGVCERDFSAFLFSGALPNESRPDATIAPFWGDLLLDTFITPAPIVRYATTGTAPNRKFTVEWANARFYSFFGGTFSSANFQVQLHEASGTIGLAYGPYTSNSFDDTSWYGIIGIENADHSDGVVPVSCAMGMSACGYTQLQALQNQVIEFIVPNTPELFALVISPTGADPGDQIEVSIEVRNIGPQPAGSTFDVDVYLSSDAVINPANDVALGTLNFSSILGQSQETLTLTATLSSTITPGIYRIGAVVDPDNDVAEAVESNNTSIAANVFLVGYDLAIAIDTLPPTGPGEVITFPLRLLNNGSAVDDVEWAVYLSRDQAPGMGDVLLASGTSSVPAVPVTELTVTATVPVLVPGDYYAVAVVDPNNLITEADENNNSDGATDITEISGADVVARNPSGGVFAFRGETYRVTGTILNTGGSTAVDLFYSFHFSTNQLITFSDPLLGEFGPITLAPGARIEVSHDVLVPADLMPGPYYLGFIGDSQTTILEELENNNIVHMRDTITVRDPAPDLTGFAIVLPPTGAAGESLTIERVISNAGNAPAEAPYTIYLSSNTAFEAGDLEISSATEMLGPRTDSRDIDNVRLPSSVPAGRYYLIYVFDPANAISELYEDNNVIVSETAIDVLASQLVILSRVLPTATIDLAYEFRLAAAGGAGSYTWSISDGGLPPGLSLDPASGLISGAATALGAYNFTVTVSDGSLDISDDLSILVAEQTLPLEIVTRSIVPAFVGRPFEYPLTAFGGVPPYTWTAREALPAGLTFSADGTIAGTPSMAAIATINFNVTDSAGGSTDRPIVVRIINSDASVRFANDVLPDGTLGEEYLGSIHVEPGTGASPYTFQLSGGALPPGLRLEHDQLLGVPTAVGDFIFEVRLSDSRGDFDVNLFVITVREASGVSISTTSLPSGLVGQPYFEEGMLTVRVKAFSASMAGATITFSMISGTLPPGLTMASDGAISGTPTADGIYSFLVEARDDAGQVDHRALGIFIDEPPPVEPEKPLDKTDCSCSATERSNGSLAGLLILGALLVVRRRRGQAERAASTASGEAGRRIHSADNRPGWMLLVMALLAPAPASAQLVPYFQSTRSETYVHRTGGSSLPFSNLDDGTATAMLPFPFRFYDSDYTSVIVGTNGAVSFDINTTFISTFADPIPSAGEPEAVIALFWDDLEVSGVTTHVEGTAPARVFILQWEGISHYPAPSGGFTEFQLWLYEGPAGRFEIHYGPAMGIIASTWSGAVGYENVLGSAGAYILPCGGTCDGSTFTSNVDVVYSVQQDAGEEIVAQVVTGPAVVYPGIQFEVVTQLASLHQNPLGPFVYEVQLVASGQSTPGTTIMRSAPVTLTPYQVLQVRTSTAIPIDTPPGRYQLALVVDVEDQVAEPDENNNVLISARDMRVDPRQPDFTVASVAPGQTSAMAGTQVTFTLQLSNSGNLDGSTEWKIYLSRNAVISTDDLEIASGTEALPLLQSAQLTVPAMLPSTLTSGAYYVGAIADPENAVPELSEVNNTGIGRDRLTINAGAVSVTTESLPLAYAGVHYSTFMSAAGGDGTYGWTVAGGALPMGLALIPTTGELRGRPMAAGTATFTVQVLSGGQTATKELTLEVREIAGGLTIVTSELLPGTVGGAYPPAEPETAIEDQQHIVTVGGSGGVTFTLAGAGPPGLVLDPDGYLHGVPTQLGVFDVIVSATDTSTTVTRTIPLTIAEPGRLTLVAASLPDGRIDENYDYQFRVVGQNPGSTLTFATNDVLPPGLTLAPTGRVIGAPAQVGSWTFSVNVVEGMDVNGPRDSATYRISIISSADFRITPTTAAGALVGMEYEAVFEAVQGTPPFTWRIIGPALPRGLVTEIRTTNMRETFVVKGTPEMESFVSELITVDDAVGRHAEVPIVFSVTEPPPPPPMMAMDEGCSCATEARSRSSGVEGVLAFGLLLGIFVGRSRRRAR